MLKRATLRPPERPFNHPLQLPAFFINLSKHKALKLSFNPINLDRARHTCRQLVAIAKELMTKPIERYINRTSQEKRLHMELKLKLTLQARNR